MTVSPAGFSRPGGLRPPRLLRLLLAGPGTAEQRLSHLLELVRPGLVQACRESLQGASKLWARLICRLGASNSMSPPPKKRCFPLSLPLLLCARGKWHHRHLIPGATAHLSARPLQLGPLLILPSPSGTVVTTGL